MPELFRRDARIQISEFDVRGLRTTFRVEKEFRNIPSKLEVKVYNLSQQTREAIVDTSRQRARAVPQQPGIVQPRKRVFVGLDAGYENFLTRLFYGDVFRSRVEISSPDTIMVVEALAGGVSLYSARVSRSFRPGVRVETVMLHLVEALGCEPGNAQAMLRGVRLKDRTTTFTAGVVLSGSAEYEFSRLCEGAGFDWMIDDGRLVLARKRDSILETAPLLSPETGLIGSPTKDQITRIVKGKCKIMPDVAPGRNVEVQCSLFKEVIRIYKTTVVGDTHGDDWYIDFEGRKPLPPLATRALQP